MNKSLLCVTLGISFACVSCRMLGLAYVGHPPYAGYPHAQTSPYSAYQPYPAYQPQQAHQPPVNYGHTQAQPIPSIATTAATATPLKNSSRYSSFDLGYPKIKTAPYTIWGIRHRPMSPQQALNYKATGICSIYKGGPQNAISEKPPASMVTAAHKTLPLPCVVKVTNHKNGRTIYARVNDRGPFTPGRILDISTKGGELLGFSKQGLTTVTVEVMSVGDGKLKVRK